MKQAKHRMRLLSALLTLLLLFGSLPLTGLAMATGDTISYDWRIAYHGGQQSGDAIDDQHASGSAGTHYNNRPYWYNHLAIDVITVTGSDLKKQYGGKTYAYCIEHGAKYDDLKRVIEGVDGDFSRSPYWLNLGRDKQYLIQQLMPHCFPAMTPAELGVSTVDDAYAATQILLWEITEGYRDENGYLTNAALRDGFLKYTYTGNGHSYGEDTPAMTAYRNIEQALITHETRPSTMTQDPATAPTLNLSWNGTRYEATLTDTNGVLDQFTIPSTIGSSVHVERSGSTLTFWSTAAISSTVTWKADKNLKRKADTGALAVMANAENSASQKMIIAGVVDDPVSAYLKLETDSADLRITKTCQGGGSVSGFTFRVTGANGYDKRFTTGSSGVINVKGLEAGVLYTIEEIMTSTQAGRYRQPNKRYVTLEKGKTSVVRFVNEPHNRAFIVQKIDDSYGYTEDIPFRIEHLGADENSFVYYGRTDDKGEVKITTATVLAYYKAKLTANSNNYIKAANAVFAEAYGYEYNQNTVSASDLMRYQAISTLMTRLSLDIDELYVTEGSYSVTELLWDFPDGTDPTYYEAMFEDDPYDGTAATTKAGREWTRTVTLDPATEAEAAKTVTFEMYNYADIFRLKIVKTSEDGVVNGVPIDLEFLGSSKTNAPLYTLHNTTRRTTVDGVATDGVIYTSESMCAGWYRITEPGCKERGYDEQPAQYIELKRNANGDKTVATVTFANKVTKYQVPLRKTSTDGTVSGFAFTITGKTDWNSSVSLSCKSNAKGEIVLSSGSAVMLYPGTYTITEKLTTAQAKIYEQPAAQTITVTRGQTNAAVVSFQNTPKRVPVNIQKYCVNGAKAGFHFTITGTTYWNEKVELTDLVSDSDGKIAERLYPGTYTITEQLTAEQAEVYEPMAPRSFTITKGQTNPVGILLTNILKPVPLEAYKTSDDGVVEGFVFTLTGTQSYPSSETISVELISDGTGLLVNKADGSKVTINPGTYTLTEQLTTEQAKAYQTLDPVSFTVKSGQTDPVKVRIHNTLKPTPVNIFKHTPSGSPQGFAFRLTGTQTYPSGKTVSYDLVSDTIGCLRIKGTDIIPELYPGTYTVTEVLTAAQAELYEQAAPLTFTVAKGDTAKKYDINNVYRRGSIEIVKSADGGGRLGGAEYLLEISVDRGKTWSPVTDKQCSSAGLTDGRLTTGADGKVRFEGLATGSGYRYRVTETRAPAGYALLAKPLFDGTLPYIDNNGTLLRDVSLSVTDDVTITLPSTGGHGIPVALAVSVLLLLAGGLAVCGWLVIRRTEI